MLSGLAIRGAGERTAAEHMGVDVRHGLDRLRAGVGRHTKILGPQRYGWRRATLLPRGTHKRAGVDNTIITIDAPE